VRCRSLKLALFSCAVLAVSAQATVINFADRPAGPSTFAAAGPAQTLVYNVGGVTTTFTGGVILTNETSQTTDNTNVYATASFGNATLTNPLVVMFSQPIQNFQIDILNALAGSYTLADNAGHSLNFTLATTGGSLATKGFAAAGNRVTITYNDVAASGFDFAIDNVLFNQPLTVDTPEPGTLLTLALGLGLMLAGTARKRLASR
jgi:hypothetical protein